MNKFTAILAGISAVAFASGAQAQTVTVNYTGTPVAIPGSNDFQSQLAGLGLTHYVSTGLQSLVLSGPASLNFAYMGSESGFFDTFTAGGTTYTENFSGVDNHFGAPIYFGTTNYAAGGPLTNLIFSTLNPLGANGTIGTEGLGLFLGCPPRALTCTPSSGQSVTEFYLAYDDQVSHADDNHDDFIVRVRVGSPVPEPATWAMMLVGFGAVGYGMRRRTRKVALQAA